MLLTDPKRRGHAVHTGPRGEAPELGRWQREWWKNVGKGLQSGFRGRERVRQPVRLRTG